jgi:hypothetical protein
VIKYHDSNLDSDLQQLLKGFDNSCHVRIIFQRGFNNEQVSLYSSSKELLYDKIISTHTTSALAGHTCIDINSTDKKLYLYDYDKNKYIVIPIDDKYKRILINHLVENSTWELIYTNLKSLYE